MSAVRCNGMVAAAWLGCALIGGSVGTPAHAQGPSFACGKVRPGSIEEMICRDSRLSALDRKLADVFAAASKKAVDEHPPVLKAEQRGWIKGRDECWKSADKRGCVESAYVRRIAELQATYRLVPGKGPVTYVCDGQPANEVTATFFPTDPPTLYAERGDSVSLMFLQPSGSGARYQGRNESLWEHQGEALITWGYGAPEMRCKLASAAPASKPGAPRTTLPDVPVAGTAIVAPAEYAQASAVAARGGTPLDIALAVAGAFEGSMQHVIQVNEGGEAPVASRVTVLRDGLLDDSIGGERWDVALARSNAGAWKISEVKRAWRCRRGANTHQFAAGRCP